MVTAYPDDPKPAADAQKRSNRLRNYESKVLMQFDSRVQFDLNNSIWI